VINQRADLPCPWGIFPPLLLFGRSDNAASLCRADLLDKAAFLISRCDTQHSCHTGKHSVTRLPTRVVSTQDLRIVESQGLRAQYLCLSHCWGSSQPLKTTTANLSAHLASLSWDAIPTVYQEAIVLARKLNIAYVWIDSLCIVQDDKDDWVRESAAMCDIYENAYLTIAATSSPDCCAGMWDLSRSSVTEFSGTNAEGHPYRLGAIKNAPNYHPDQATRSQDRPTLRAQWPLLDRAWVFQERMLSSRVLHFCHGEIAWECKEETLCECGRMESMGKDRRFHDLLDQGDEKQLAAEWRQLVEAYVLLSITFPADKLPALSGLAKRFARRRPGTTYLAGLWDTSLITDLLWIKPIDPPSTAPPQGPTALHGPSWSWVSTSGRILFLRGTVTAARNEKSKTVQLTKTYATITNASCKPATADATGSVLGGSVEIVGRVLDGVVAVDHAQLRFQYSRISVRMEGTQVAFGMDVYLNPVSTCNVYLDAGGGEYLDQRTQTVAVDGIKVACLPMARVRHEVVSQNGYAMESESDFALLLVPLDGTPGKYRRIGMLAQESGSRSITPGVDAMAQFWKENPSILEAGGREQNVTIY